VYSVAVFVAHVSQGRCAIFVLHMNVWREFCIASMCDLDVPTRYGRVAASYTWQCLLSRAMSRFVFFWCDTSPLTCVHCINYSFYICTLLFYNNFTTRRNASAVHGLCDCVCLSVCVYVCVRLSQVDVLRLKWINGSSWFLTRRLCVIRKFGYRQKLGYFSLELSPNSGLRSIVLSTKLVDGRTSCLHGGHT